MVLSLDSTPKSSFAGLDPPDLAYLNRYSGMTFLTIKMFEDLKKKIKNCYQKACSFYNYFFNNFYPKFYLFPPKNASLYPIVIKTFDKFPNSR